MFTTMFTRAGEENRTPVSAWEHSQPKPVDDSGRLWQVTEPVDDSGRLWQVTKPVDDSGRLWTNPDVP